MKIIKTANYKEAQQSPSLDARTKAQINSELRSVGLDGNGRFQESDEGISIIWEALKNNGFVLADAVSKDLFMGPKGNRKLRIQHLGPDPQDAFTPGSDIENSFVVYTWQELAPGKFEILAYLS